MFYAILSIFGPADPPPWTLDPPTSKRPFMGIVWYCNLPNAFLRAFGPHSHNFCSKMAAEYCSTP